MSDVLHPDGSDYDRFLQAEVGRDENGAPVTVLSALARQGLEPWTEARELAALGRTVAQTRLKAHLLAIADIPMLAQASGEVATRLVSLLPRHAPQGASDLAERIGRGGFPIPMSWLLIAVVVVAIVVWIYRLAQTG